MMYPAQLESPSLLTCYWVRKCKVDCMRSTVQGDPTIVEDRIGSLCCSALLIITVTPLAVRAYMRTLHSTASTCGCGAFLVVATAVRPLLSMHTGHTTSEPQASLAEAGSSTGTQAPPQSGVRTRRIPALHST